MIYLSIDYGQKRTGTAFCNAEESLIFPCCTIAMQDKEHYFAEIFALVEEKKVEAFVVGLPLRGDGSESETTRQVQNMVGRLKRRSPLPIFLIDETLTSSEAEERLRALGKKPKKNQHIIDQMAAIIILESFLALPQHQRTHV